MPQRVQRSTAWLVRCWAGAGEAAEAGVGIKTPFVAGGLCRAFRGFPSLALLPARGSAKARGRASSSFRLSSLLFSCTECGGLTGTGGRRGQ